MERELPLVMLIVVYIVVLFYFNQSRQTWVMVLQWKWWWTDRLITIGHPAPNVGALIKQEKRPVLNLSAYLHKSITWTQKN